MARTGAVVKLVAATAAPISIAGAVVCPSGMRATHMELMDSGLVTQSRIQLMTGTATIQAADAAGSPSRLFDSATIEQIVNADIDAGAGIVGTKLAAGAGVLAHLSAAGAFDNITNVTSRALDDITDGATYARVKGAGLTSGVVNSTGLTTGAVIAGKIATGGLSAGTQIADYVVGGQALMGKDDRSTLNRNSHFMQYTRG